MFWSAWSRVSALKWAIPPLILTAGLVKNLLRALISQGIEALRANGTLPADSLPPDFVVERPKTRDHGDFAIGQCLLG